MDSMAARIAKDVDPSTEIDDKQPYGEVCNDLESRSD